MLLTEDSVCLAVLLGAVCTYQRAKVVVFDAFLIPSRTRRRLEEEPRKREENTRSIPIDNGEGEAGGYSRGYEFSPALLSFLRFHPILVDFDELSVVVLCKLREVLHRGLEYLIIQSIVLSR